MKKKISFTLNILIIVLAIIGNILTFTSTDTSAGLTSKGIENFKYFTILSNEFCFFVALTKLYFDVKGKKFPIIYKFIAATSVGLTFLTIAAFLGPIYGHINLYRRANLYFHLIIPLLAMFEFVLLDADQDELPFNKTILSIIPVIVYGCGYLFNILINGKGTWPNSNDWYGFLNWGMPVAMVIFAFSLLATWLIACILRYGNKKIR